MWNKGGQEARFRAKFEIGIEDGDSILDVGCGFADMYAYLVHYNFACNYTGIDLCEAFLQVCREKYPRIDVRHLNLLDYTGDEKWDWCFLVGTFNIRFSDGSNWSFVQQMLRKMFAHCNKGMAADFLSNYVDFKKEMSYHQDVRQVFDFAKTLSKRVALRHDYMPYEFTLYVYKTDAVDAESVFSDYQKRGSGSDLRRRV